jgi:hypothetical protein
MSRSWDKQRERDKMRRQGSEDIRGCTPIGRLVPHLRPHRPPLSKAELRAIGEAAVAEWNARRAEE